MMFINDQTNEEFKRTNEFHMAEFINQKKYEHLSFYVEDHFDWMKMYEAR